MQKRSINAAGAPQPKGGYAQVCELSDAKRWAFVSGADTANGGWNGTG